MINSQIIAAGNLNVMHILIQVIMDGTQQVLNTLQSQKEHNEIDTVSEKMQSTKKIRMITIDLRNTQYKVLREVAQKMLHWRTIPRKDVIHYEEPNIIWTDSYISEEQLRSLLPYQKINHFPSSFQLGNKHFLSKNIIKMKKKFQQEYDFFPETWFMPDDFERFKTYQEKNRQLTWIFKPSSSSQGKGIIITRSIDVIEEKIHNSRKGNQFVLQKYIVNPYLIEGLKFDLRIYVLVKSFCPLKIFIYKQGLARFATSNYQKPEKANLRNTFMHLTNYAINKKNPNFSFSEENQHQGHKRTYSSILKFLKQKGHDVQALQKGIHDLIVKTICSVQPLLSHLYRTSTPNRETYSENCFQILGFDILIDEHLKPHLLEVNHTPSFRTDSQLDYHIKSSLLRDTLLIVNVNPRDKYRFEDSKCKLIIKFEHKNKSVNLTKMEKHQNKHINGYIRIYPPESHNKDEYKQFIEYSHLVFDIWTGIIKKNNSQVILQPPETSKLTKKIIQPLHNVHSAMDRRDSTNNPKYIKKQSVFVNNYMPTSAPITINKEEIDLIKATLMGDDKKNEEAMIIKRNQDFLLEDAIKSKPSQSGNLLSHNINQVNNQIFTQNTQQPKIEQENFYNFLEKKSAALMRRYQRVEMPIKQDLNYYLNQTFHRRNKTRVFTKRQYLSKSRLNNSCNYKKLNVIQFPL